MCKPRAHFSNLTHSQVNDQDPLTMKIGSNAGLHPREVLSRLCRHRFNEQREPLRVTQELKDTSQEITVA
jgi:hypothetical protein